MTTPAAIRKSDLARAADVAKEKGVPVMVERGGLRFTVFPDLHSATGTVIDITPQKGGDLLSQWRRGRENEGEARGRP